VSERLLLRPVRPTTSSLTAVVLAVVLAIGLLTTGCAGRSNGPRGAFTEGGVSVWAELTDREASTSLRVRLSPQPGFHVYALDLPPDGIDGLGRPTRVQVASGGAVTGPARADRSTVLLRPSGLTVDLPVFPAGPVVINVPIRRTGTTPPTIVVSYAACSPTRCLMPVTHTLRLA